MYGMRAVSTIAGVVIGVVVSAVAVVGVAVSSASAAPGSACSGRPVNSNFHEKAFSEELTTLGAIPSDVVSVPTWSGSFTTAGSTYPYTMVGTDPGAGSATTNVPVVIVPLRMEFASDSCVMQKDSMAADLEASPLFQPTPTYAGTTQYVDALQRGNFWSKVGTTSPDWHLLLNASDIAPVTLHVPASQGLTALNTVTNRVIGIVGGHWLGVQLHNLLNSLHVDPGALVVFESYNTYATDQNPVDCVTVGCAYFSGYHGALFSDSRPHAINTYAYAAYVDGGDAVPATWDLSAHVLSHELIEWANDPFDHGEQVRGQPTFMSNMAPAWTSAGSGDPTACLPTLEVADPVEAYGIGATVAGSPKLYILADAVFLSWFARETPSTAIVGLYDAAGFLSTFSQAC